MEGSKTEVKENIVYDFIKEFVGTDSKAVLEDVYKINLETSLRV